MKREGCERSSSQIKGLLFWVLRDHKELGRSDCSSVEWGSGFCDWGLGFMYKNQAGWFLSLSCPSPSTHQGVPGLHRDLLTGVETGQDVIVDF